MICRKLPKRKIEQFDYFLKQWENEWSVLEGIIDSYHSCSHRIRMLERKLNELSKISRHNNGDLLEKVGQKDLNLNET